MRRIYAFLKVKLQFKMAADRVPSLKLSGIGFVKMLLSGIGFVKTLLCMFKERRCGSK